MRRSKAFRAQWNRTNFISTMQPNAWSWRLGYPSRRTVRVWLRSLRSGMSWPQRRELASASANGNSEPKSCGRDAWRTTWILFQSYGKPALRPAASRLLIPNSCQRSWLGGGPIARASEGRSAANLQNTIARQSGWLLSLQDTKQPHYLGEVELHYLLLRDHAGRDALADPVAAACQSGFSTIPAMASRRPRLWSRCE